jgi:hypothetical protein
MVLDLFQEPPFIPLRFLPVKWAGWLSQSSWFWLRRGVKVAPAQRAAPNGNDMDCRFTG